MDGSADDDAIIVAEFSAEPSLLLMGRHVLLF
jgi:hypothetical protein